MEQTQSLSLGTHQQQAEAWRRKFLFPMPGDPGYGEALNQAVLFQYLLIEEEYTEMQEQLGDILAPLPFQPATLDKSLLLKEMADLVFTVYQLSALLGMDLSTALDRVYTSNMTKVDDDGNPVFNEDGKAMKTANYVKPDLSGLY
jgi:NTP pyrophosphatase (non-canonical NTP hydrolase)